MSKLSLLKTFEYWNAVPLVGRWVFGWLLLLASPYTGTLSVTVHKLQAGAAEASMREWWLLRNPFNCIHAAALTNLGECVGGLAVVGWIESQPLQYRCLVRRLDIEFLKKAKGRITAVCHLDTTKPLMPDSQTKTDLQAVAELRDASGAVV
eukprot:jgi/Hompol1/2852/HPOL_006194-RA